LRTTDGGKKKTNEIDCQSSQFEGRKASPPAGGGRNVLAENPAIVLHIESEKKGISGRNGGPVGEVQREGWAKYSVGGATSDLHKGPRKGEKREERTFLYKRKVEKREFFRLIP